MKAIDMVVITIGGPPGSGTTTIAKMLAARLKLKYVYIGDIFRELAKRKDMSLAEFGNYAGGHPEIDRELDKRQLEIARAGHVILEGRVSGWVAAENEVEAFKIWLEATLSVRVDRCSEREEKNRDEVEREIVEREESERSRYKDIYKFDIDDLSFYDIVVDTGPLTPEQITDLIVTKLQGSGR
jgi:cytidylate kinase